MIGFLPSSPGRPIITNSPERKRKLAGRVRPKLNRRSVQCFTHVTVSWWNGLLAGASAVATAETVMRVLRLRDGPSTRSHATGQERNSISGLRGTEGCSGGEKHFQRRAVSHHL